MPSNSKDIGSTNGTASEVSDDLWAMVLRGVDCSGYLTTRMRIKTTLPPAASTTNNNETNQYFYHPDHLGSSSMISDKNGKASQHLQYLPYGESFVEQKTTATYYTPYRFSGKEKDEETQYSYFGARYYDSDLSVWLSVDPMASSRSWISPYNYCQWNPVMRVDPSGALDNPIYDVATGAFLGTDDKGVQGDAILMNKSDFKQGMSHDEAMSKGKTLDNMSYSEAHKFCKTGNFNKFIDHYNSLSSRPDWDGFVTINEGISWAKNHPYALNSEDPNTMLFIDASKLDFGSLETVDFLKIGTIEPKNLYNFGNVLCSTINSTTAATVYALGRVDMILLDKNGHVRIVNNEATNYDWNLGGGNLRSTAISFEMLRVGINPYSHGFRTYYYGIGKIKVSNLEMNFINSMTPTMTP